MTRSDGGLQRNSCWGNRAPEEPEQCCLLTTGDPVGKAFSVWTPGPRGSLAWAPGVRGQFWAHGHGIHATGPDALLKGERKLQGEVQGDKAPQAWAGAAQWARGSLETTEKEAEAQGWSILPRNVDGHAVPVSSFWAELQALQVSAQ